MSIHFRFEDEREFMWKVLARLSEALFFDKSATRSSLCNIERGPFQSPIDSTLKKHGHLHRRQNCNDTRSRHRSAIVDCVDAVRGSCNEQLIKITPAKQSGDQGPDARG